MKKILKIVGLCLIGAFVIFTFFFLWKQSQPVPIVYELVAPQQRDIVKKTVATGALEARVQVELKPQVTGIVDEIKVQAGDHVNIGDVVATIRVIPDMNQLNQAQNAVETAKIELKQTERNAQRCQNLYEQGVVSREENEQMQTSLSKARENLAAAQYQIDVITKGSSERSGKVNTTVVKSTMKGTVLNVPVKVGTSVSGSSQFSQGTTIAKVGDLNDVIFRGNIDETEVAKLKVGMSVNLSLGAMQNVNIPAELEYIAPEGELQNGAKMFEIKASTRIPDDIEIRSGYSVNASIVLGESKNAISVNESCISFENGMPYVYRLTSDQKNEKKQVFERIPVELGLSDGLYIEITNGISLNMLLRGIKK